MLSGAALGTKFTCRTPELSALLSRTWLPVSFGINSYEVISKKPQLSGRSAEDTASLNEVVWEARFPAAPSGIPLPLAKTTLISFLSPLADSMMGNAKGRGFNTFICMLDILGHLFWPPLVTGNTRVLATLRTSQILTRFCRLFITKYQKFY